MTQSQIVYLSPCWRRKGRAPSSAVPRCERCRQLSRRPDGGETGSKSDPTRCPRDLQAHCSRCRDLDGATDKLSHDWQTTLKAKLWWEGQLTVVIIRIHVEIWHLPTPDGPIKTSTVAGVAVFTHCQWQNGAAKNHMQILMWFLTELTLFVHHEDKTTKRCEMYLCALKV